MNTLQNLHQHTTFCDGKNTPEEIVLEAIKKGFGAIGFSGHCNMSYASYCMSLEQTAQYKQEVTRLKEKYADQIDVFLGIEYDISCPEPPVGYDYVIGSLHGLRFDGVDYEFDGVPAHYQKMIDEHFGGDGMAYAKEYYHQLTWLPEFGKIDIIGHFDIVTKHLEAYPFFDPEEKEYRDAAIEAAEALAGKIPLFEVNTGTMARGYRSVPFPQPFIIKEMKRLGYGVVLSSDCHQKELMDFRFEECKELLRSCGYTERHILTKDGFIPVPL